MIEAADNYVRIWTGGRSFLLRESMRELEARVSAHGFIRAHRRALVPIAGVRALNWTDGELVAVLGNGVKVPVSRRRRATVAVAMAAARVYSDAPGQARRSSILFWSALSMLPDTDVIAFSLGIDYAAPWGHRGATHSLVFALAVAAIAALAAPRFGFRADDRDCALRAAFDLRITTTTQTPILAAALDRRGPAGNGRRSDLKRQRS